MNRRDIVTVLGHALVVVALIVVPSLWLAPPTFRGLPASQLTMIGIFPLGYLVSVLILSRSRARDASIRASYVILVGIASFGVCFAVVILSEWLLPEVLSSEFPRQALVTSVCLGLLGLVSTNLPRRGTLLAPAIMSLFVLGGVVGHAAYRFRLLPRPEPAMRSVSYLDTSLYALKLTRYQNILPKQLRWGGGIAPWGSDYLLADGNGSLYVFRFTSSAEGVELIRLPRTVPLNPSEFIAGAYEIFKNSQHLGLRSFRVADVLVRHQGDIVTILASHHYWHTAQQCFVLRVSALTGTRDQILDKKIDLKWRTLFETSPCLPFNTSNASGLRFDGWEVGGRMAFLNQEEVLLSVGDQGLDGVNTPQMLSQDATSSYGKILQIRLATGEAQVYSLGHRNPQGLDVDASGRVWSTEHGPRGGDEINVIKKGANYGWPLVTYGTDYARLSWPLNTKQGRHEGFEQPLYAFVPSVGLSSLTVVTSALFPLWQGDLLVSSLKARTLWRMRVTDGRVIFAEPVPVSQRVRDVLIGGDGRVILWTDESELVSIEPTEARVGDTLIAQCRGCHSLNYVEPSGLAPNLSMIVGRPVASLDDFSYSDAMKAFGGRWTRKRLDAFLADPQVVVPGTTMQFVGIKDPADRERLITYLEQPPKWE